MSSTNSGFNLDFLKTTLNLTFEANLEVLKEHFPNFYQRFKDYNPQDYGLELDSDGNLNIAAQGNFIFDGDPQKIAKQQFDSYMQAPTRNVYQLNIKKDEETDDLFDHIGFLKTLAIAGNKAIAESSSSPTYEKPDFHPIMCVLGIGIGYQLEFLTQENIGYLNIYEPNPDFFYASLFVVNYTALVKKFTSANRRLSIVIGLEPEQYIEELHRSLVDSGTYQAAMLPVYKTYNSKTNDETLSRFLDSATNFYSGFGFVEDEIISINHSIQNLKNEIPVLPKELQLVNDKDKRVFIVGSGPSLDDAMPFLKKNRENILILSGGSSLVPLYKAGIVPDLHFEIERTEELADWIDVLGDKDYFSQVTLVTMNTVSPKVIALFGEAFLFVKPNDGGTDLLLYSHRHKVNMSLMLFGSNPTVTNAAASFAAKVGFKNLYFVGMDLGFIDERKHHSKDSIYYGEDSYFEEEFEKVRGTLKQVKGNFQEYVLTTSIFDWARHSIEYVLRRPEYSDINAFNCSNGVAIDRAKPCRFEEIEIKNDEHEDLDLKEMLRKISSKQIFHHEHARKQLLESADLIIAAFEFLADKKFADTNAELEDMMNIFKYHFNTIYKLLTEQDPFAGRVVLGSLNYLQSTVTGKLYTIRTNEKRKEFFKIAIKIQQEYFERMAVIFKRDVLSKWELK